MVKLYNIFQNFVKFYLKRFLNFKTSNPPITPPDIIPSKKTTKRYLTNCATDINIFASIKTPSKKIDNH